jgi:hypothetical protein
MYITRHDSVKLAFDLYSFKGKAEEVALIDSGATENFINYKTVARLQLGTKKLEQARPVRNIDGTENKAGSVTNYCNLMISRGDTKERVHFYVTNLGKDRFIFRYPSLAKFNPEINWPEAEIKGPRVRAETLVKGNMT